MQICLERYKENKMWVPVLDPSGSGLSQIAVSGTCGEIKFCRAMRYARIGLQSSVSEAVYPSQQY
jgi:hypothetical protein